MRVRATAVLVALLAAASVLGAVPSKASSPGRFAVLVGVSDYAGRTKDTYGGVGDVRAMRAALVEAGWPQENIVELTDGYASAASIRDALRWLRSKASADSLSVFHFSGHVKQVGGDPDRDGEAVDELLWASDNRFITDGELATSLRAVPGRLWVDIAGCEAAGFDDGLSSGRVLFTSSSLEHEKSYEQPEWGTSVFTGLLVERGLRRRAAAAGPDGRISIQSAFAFAADQAPRVTARQRTGPQHPLLAGGDGTPWYLAAPPPPSRPAPRRLLLL